MYDVIIVGLGPAGISAAIYASRYNMNVLIIGSQTGGTVSWTHLIDNYPGLPEISGIDLSNKLLDHVKKYKNCEVKFDSVNSIQKVNDVIYVSTNDGKISEGKSLILALGTDKKKANIKGESEFTGKGVSYCTVCDGMFYKNKTVTIIGSGNSALKAVNHLSNIAERIYLIIRKDNISGNDELDFKDIINNPKIEIINNSNVTEIKGVNKVESIIVKTNLENGESAERELQMDGVFIEIGSVPYSILLRGLGMEMNEQGFIKIDNNCKTNIDNIYAAGDITTGFSDLKQIIVAEAMGAIAATTAKKYLK